MNPRINEPTEMVIGAATEVHSALGPGLLESTLDKLMSVHDAQLITYLKLGGWPVGLPMNFNVEALQPGLKRKVNHLPG